MNPWLYNNEEYEWDPVEGPFGFIYEIENLQDGMKYIGRKYFTLAATKMVKGKKKKIRKESDWKKYHGSSPHLKTAIDLVGTEHFKRTILCFFDSKGEGNYMEAKMIFDHDAILDGRYYNAWCSVRVQAGHVRKLLFNQPKKEEGIEEDVGS